MIPMGDILTRCDSDKNNPHRYASVYERLFGDREAVEHVLELGVSYGGSVLAWREIFPNATIVGLDIGPSEHCPRLDRLEIHQGDRRDYNAVMNCVRGRKFDLIIDNASHKIGDQLTSLFWLWPHVALGGKYVIEEFDVDGGRGPSANRDLIQLFKSAEMIDTIDATGGIEPLLVLRKHIFESDYR